MNLEDGMFIVEGKGLRSHQTSKARQAAIDAGFDFSTGSFKDKRLNVSSRAFRKFETIQRTLVKKLTLAVRSLGRGSVGVGNWKDECRHHLRLAYRRAFELGMESAGSGIRPDSRDEAWMATAVAQEMAFLNKALEDVRRAVRNVPKARLTAAVDQAVRRLSRYVDALQHMYYAGRVIGSPRRMAIYWIAPLDRATCECCRFMNDQSPFLKDRLPTVPRAGDTKCLHNCRCRLVMREVSQSQLRDLDRSMKPRSWYARQLQLIKSRA